MTAITLESLHHEVVNLGSAITKALAFSKETLDFNETAQYTNQSRSYLYKLTSQGLIPHYKPNGKKIYFKRSELDEWMLRNKSYSSDEIAEQVDNHMAGGSK
ncbi:MAG: helix-turn-helix domain-containing protein [Methylophaga sp.]|nr:helix-turn-helix domain-containing protein [Methylophaga sp.]